MSIVEITPGQGGADARNFAADLAESLAAWARRAGHKARIGSSSGTVTVTLDEVEPSGLRWLSGTHRIQHVPPRGKARQTSYVTLAVLGDAREARIPDLSRDDPHLRVETMRGTGPGGQHKNKNQTAVRITDELTGAVVSRDGRSQYQNLTGALAELARIRWERDHADGEADRQADREQQRQPVITFTHSAFNDTVMHHATRTKWPLRHWAQGKFNPVT